jgi:hypothetical protein
LIKNLTATRVRNILELRRLVSKRSWIRKWRCKSRAGRPVTVFIRSRNSLLDTEARALLRSRAGLHQRA